MTEKRQLFASSIAYNAMRERQENTGVKKRI